MLKSDMEVVLWGLSSLLLARRELLPFIQDGNKGCGGRLRCRSLLVSFKGRIAKEQLPSQPIYQPAMARWKR